MDGEYGEMREIRIASWWRRLGAWLIDIILVGILWDLLAGIAGPFHFFGFGPMHGPFFQHWFVDLGSDDAIVLFVYWTLLEGYRGRSLGKMALGLKVTNMRGDEIDLPRAAIESFGKAFLLPLDCLIGWIAMPGSGQRLFNRLSETIVVVVDEAAPEGVRYVRPE
ncbi:RDD family protein [Methanocrinis sp.]|uniref:RDD family protein n=1 Tax=Methanocrinis sp. TaxID=3101522 RepID=UPI003D14F2BD